MRWATLPTSGRGPLDPPATAMDRWPVGYPLPGNTHPILGPEVTYPWEQSRLYVTKRSLVLVCKEWKALAAEYLYESLVVEIFGVGKEEKLLTSLRTIKRGERSGGGSNGLTHVGTYIPLSPGYSGMDYQTPIYNTFGEVGTTLVAWRRFPMRDFPPLFNPTP